VSVPLAARVFDHRISRRQLLAVLVVAASLAVLPLGLAPGRDSLRGASLVLVTGGLSAVAVLTALAGAATLRALAAGLLYGVCDAAIKAVFVCSGHHGGLGTRLAWAGLAGLTTFGGFVAFQAALRGGRAVAAISLMNAGTALAALGCGVIALGESLGCSPAIVAAHLVAIGLLLASVPVLAAAQAEITAGGESAPGGDENCLEPDAAVRESRGEHASQAGVARRRVRRIGLSASTTGPHPSASTPRLTGARRASAPAVAAREVNPSEALLRW
jgi:hypothetical protein